MSLATGHRHANRSLSSDRAEDAWKICILIVCIAAPCLLVVLYKIWKRKKRSQRGANETVSPNGVQHINPAEFMQFCAQRERRRAASKARKLVDASQLDSVAPLKSYKDVVTHIASETTPGIQKPPPTLLTGGLARWRSWVGTAKEKERDAAVEMGGQLDQCSICLAGFTDHDEIRHTLCGHVFHAACLERWLTEYRGRCPLCQMEFGLTNEEC